MSRIAKKPIEIPEKTDVVIEDGVVSVKGPLGELSRTLRPEVSVVVADGEVRVTQKKQGDLFAYALTGTYASHIRNMVAGVNAPYEKKLIIEGVGFKSEVQGNTLVLSLGFSHQIKLDIPEGLTVSAEKNVVTVSGIDKEQVGSFAAHVRSLREPEPYKGKGIRYEDEVIRRKEGKKSV